MPETMTKTKTVSGKLAEQQETSSHISIKPLYTPADLEGWDYDREARLSRPVPLHARRAGHHVPRPPVDHAAICRHG